MALVVGLMLAAGGCARFFFFPDRVLRMEPDDLGLVYRNVWFESYDGTGLHGWLLPAAASAGEPLGTVVFLHGNAQNVSAHIASVYWMPSAGFNVFLFDYRGYGTSEGKPSLADVHHDAEAAIRRAATLPGVDAARLAVFGQSLGGAIAAGTVARLQHEISIRALVLDSAFSDFRGIAREKLAGFWLTWPLHVPLSYSISDEFQPAESLARISDVPVLIVHGDADDIIPVEHAHVLARAAAPGTPLWIVPGAGHIQSFEAPAMRDRLTAFLSEAFGRPASGTIAAGRAS
jgi:pimeloyl-ACP methyl ester carboxylesterase